MYHNVHTKREHESNDFTSFNQFNNFLQIKQLIKPVPRLERKGTKIERFGFHNVSIDAVGVFIRRGVVWMPIEPVSFQFLYTLREEMPDPNHVDIS